MREKPDSQKDALNHLLQLIVQQYRDDTGIVYCMTQKDCEHCSDFLRENGLLSDYYHAGQAKGDRKMVQAAWLCGKVKIVCATIAYGMLFTVH